MANMSDLHEQVRKCKDLGVHALLTEDPVDKAMYEHAFWTLMHEHGTQILDIVDDALQAYKEGKI